MLHLLKTRIDWYYNQPQPTTAMKTYCLHVREIRVFPTTIQANSLEEAKELVLAGEGDYDEKRQYCSDISALDVLDNQFETGFEDRKEIPFKTLNCDWYTLLHHLKTRLDWSCYENSPR